jgi:rod shape-determining protein MreC
MSKVRRDRNSGRKIWILLFVAVSIFCIIFFAARGRFTVPFSSRAATTVLAPFQEAVSWVGGQLQYVTSNIWEIVTVHEQNKMLKNEVIQLREQNLKADEYAAENARLHALLGYKQTTPQFDLVVGRVIGREAATWTRVIVIDRGTMDGVQPEMAVVTYQGLVGNVVEVSPNSAKVELLLDPRSAVGTLVQRPESRVAGIVQGDTTDPMVPHMVNIPRNADIVEGDTIVTSGFGGIYPKGLIVGRVREVKNDDGGLLKYAVLEPAVDFQKLEDVAVIVASREAPPVPLTPPPQTPGTETDPQEEVSAGAGK